VVFGCGFLAFFGIVLIGIAFFLALRVSSIGVVTTTPTIYQSDQPETVEQARQRLARVLPLPDSAKKVQYALYYEWIAVTELVRFEAPVEDCCAIAKQIVDQHNAKQPRGSWQMPGLRPIVPDGQDRDRPTRVSDMPELSAPWFAPDTIRKGLVAGANGSHTPAMWIDSERGVFYYQYTD
jgi:hypothetical protein